MDFGKLKVLLVDDEKSVRVSLKWILKDLGIFHFLEAENGSEALEIFRGEKVDLIISDLVMDKVSGLQLLNELKKSDNRKDIPFIFLTASTDKEVLSDADDVIDKPIMDGKDFQARVRRVLEKRQKQP